ncbi:MAG: hypothetical protein ACXVLQ_11855 [Bacteriovorax sp.]
MKNTIKINTRTDRITSKTIDSIGWGLFLIWSGIAFLAVVDWAVWLLGVGLIMITGQAARKLFEQRVDGFGLALGVCLAVAGAFRALSIPMDAIKIASWIIPALLIIAGFSILVSTWKHRYGD